MPFARYVLENAGKLEFPFRRYQVQKVWRGERPQEGRYREFTQADIDVVGRDELAFHHDVEVARVMAEALAALPVPRLTAPGQQPQLDPGLLRRHRSHRPRRGHARHRQARQADRGTPSRRCSSTKPGSPRSRPRCASQLADIRATDTSFVDRVRALGVESDLLDQGLGELAAVIEGCAAVSGDRVQVVADLRIARGLDYYTGTVFETVMEGFEGLGSICSGGRYDALATDGKTTYPGVGISLGVSRMLVPLLAAGELTASRSVPSAVLVALADEESRDPERRRRPPAARTRHPDRGRRSAAEVRQADPLRRAARHPVRVVPR